MTPLLLLAFFLAPQEKPPETCTLSGTVVNSLTGDPLDKTDLVLERLDRSQHKATARSDAKGHFSMVDLEPGRYQLTGTRNGYLETLHKAALTLEAGQTLDHLKVKLVPYAVISGIVRDTDGEPLAGSHVVLARKTTLFGQPSVEGFESQDTDDLGQYRFRDLPAGKYYVLVEQKSGGWDKVDHSPVPSRPVEAGIATFYPGVTDPSLASLVEVATGGRVTGIDITMRRSQVFRIAGRVANAPAGLSLTLQERRQGARIKDFEPHTATRNATGDFEFRGVPPGAYYIQAGPKRHAVEVNAADLEDVRIVFGPGARVKGKMRVEEDGETKLNGTSIWLTTDGRRGNSMVVDREGNFDSRELEPGQYRLHVTPYPARRFYLKSARSGETDVLSQGLTVGDSGSTPLEIVLSSDGGQVEGAVADEKEQPAPGATVVLVPAPPLRARPELFQSKSADQFGRFAFDAIAPGDYKIFAWDKVDDNAWMDPDFLKDFERYGQPLTVRPKEKQRLKVTLVGEPGK